MKSIKDIYTALSQSAYKTKNAITSPTAYSCYATVGVIAVGVLSTIATIKYIKKINDICKSEILVIDKPDENIEQSVTITNTCQTIVPTLSQKLKVATPLYLPVVGTAAFTIFCIKHGNNKAMNVLADISSALNTSQSRVQKYKNFAEGAIAAEACKNYSKDKAIDISSDNLDDPKLWFFDSFSERYFYASEYTVMAAAYHFNRNFTLRGYANVNEYYAFLGLEPIKGGDSIGWRVDKFYEDGLEPWIDFDYLEQTTTDGEKGFVIYFTWEPEDFEDISWL